MGILCRLNIQRVGLILISLATSNFLLASPATDNAWQHIKQKDFAAAQLTLSGWLKHSPNDIDATFLYAKSLAWGNKNSQALLVINNLLLKQPENSDFLLIKANILSWLNQDKLAIKTLKILRHISPGYKAAWILELKLLKKTNKNTTYQHVKNEYFLQFLSPYIEPEILSASAGTAASIIPKKKGKYILVGQSYGQLNIDSDDWYSTLFEYGTRLKRKTKGKPSYYRLTFSLENSRRFGFSDSNISSKLSFLTKQNTTITTGISASNNNSLYPVWQFLLQANKNISKNNILELKWQHKRYSNSIIDGSSISLSRYWGALLSKVTTNFTAINNNDFTINYSGSLSWFINDRDFIRFSLSRGNEIEYYFERIKVIETEFTGLDGRWNFIPNWNAIFAIGHHKQGTIYTKNGIFIGLQHKF